MIQYVFYNTCAQGATMTYAATGHGRRLAAQEPTCHNPVQIGRLKRYSSSASELHCPNEAWRSLSRHSAVSATTSSSSSTTASPNQCITSDTAACPCRSSSGGELHVAFAAIVIVGRGDRRFNSARIWNGTRVAMHEETGGICRECAEWIGGLHKHVARGALT